MGAVQNDDLEVGKTAPLWTPAPVENKPSPVVTDSVETETEDVEPQE